MSTHGASVFQRRGCLSCHSGEQNSQRGPNLLGRFGQQVPLANGELIEFDAAYVRQSIVEPRKRIAAGYSPIMPAYQVPEQITEDEILAIIDYLKSSQTNAP